MAEERTSKTFQSADQCYSYYASQRIRAYDQKIQISLEQLTKDVDADKRAQCIQSIFAAANSLQASDDTIFHATTLFDYYLANVPTNLEKEEDLTKALTAVLIAHKFNDPPKCSSFCENIFSSLEKETTITHQKLAESEMELFKLLQSNAFLSTPLQFLQVFCPQHLTGQQLDYARILALISLFSAEISVNRSEEVAKAITAISCLLTEGEDLTQKLFGEPADKTLMISLIEFVCNFQPFPAFDERMDEFDMEQLKQQLSTLKEKLM